MIRGIITIAISILPFLSMAQFKSAPGALTFTQLTGLYAMDQSVVMDYMSLRGWEFNEANKGNEEYFATVSWMFDSDQNTPLGVFVISFDNQFDKKAMEYMTTYQNYFNNMVAEAKQAGLTKLKSGIADGGIYTDYEAKSFIMRFSTVKLDGDGPFYFMSIYNKDYYHKRIAD